MIQPLTWQDAYDNDFFDALTDEAYSSLGYAPRTHGDAAPPRVPALDVRLVPSAAPPSGGDTPSRCVPPPAAGAATAVAAERTHSPVWEAGLNFNACLCGRVGDPTFPWGYCPGGRDCMDAITALYEGSPQPNASAEGCSTLNQPK